jgi:hypothetical protein
VCEERYRAISVALEVLISSEFKAQAHLHLAQSLIPKDELTWLAQMQHYAVPTRLLDFTYSPFVALYLVVRPRQENHERSRVRVSAIDAKAVNNRFRSVALAAIVKQRKKDGKHAGGASTLGTSTPTRPTATT